MKKIFLSIVFGLLFISMNAQEWKTDLTEAEKIATKENKEILLVFQGSDWCAPCIKLDRQIWSTEEFKDYAEDNYILVKADFPRRSGNKLSPEQQAKNDKLAETYNQNGYFPLVVKLNPEGEVLGEVGYKNVKPKEYIQILESLKG